MKTFKITALSVGFFTMAFVAPNLPQTPVAQAEPEGQSAFKDGERLTYRIYYNWNFVWLAAGEVTFKVFDEGKQYHFQAYGETYDSYEWFYKAKHVHNSWADKTTLLPNYSEREIQEGDRHNFEKIQFNQDSHKMTVWRSKQKGDPETKTEHNVKEQVHDILSSMYFLRTIDFTKRSKGSEEPFRIFMDKEEFPLKMRYLGKESRKKVRGAGKFNTLKFEPQVIVGDVFKDDDKMTVWVSDDENRIPVLIETPVSVGSVKVVLKDYSGLRHPLTSKQ
ncbi:MAG: DUF3108 domain-containing protein [Lewinellaceae bacterium]|nr:DUF3108 domain-containing protein [Saprospiraceae bacterium]MCB9314662.1 DUF3108 domain-containing protein [Lewinellaceae bacterium]MCB9334213.1 DUF3108 domain-containing protein [Lewinellaceae bacterium]